MKHTPARLLEACARLTAFEGTARANGRASDADLLAVAADCCHQAAAAFATRDSIVKEESDAAASIRAAGFFSGCVLVEGFTLDAECCLFTHEGICKGCGYARTQWTFKGRRFTCLTRFSIHNHTGRLLDDERQAPQARQDRAGSHGAESMH